MIRKRRNRGFWARCSLLGLFLVAWLCSPALADGGQGSGGSALTSYIPAFRDLIMGVFDSEQVCGGGAASGAGASLGPALCGYLVMSGSFFSFFAYYIAAPCFVALLLWYFYTYVLRLYRGGDDAAVSFFLKRALALLVALIMIVPARAVFGVNDSRPAAMWAIFKAVQGGMELAGKGIDPALDWAGTDYEAVKKSVGNVRKEAGGDAVSYFLLLPLTVEGYMERSREILKQLNDKVIQAVEENPEIAPLMRDGMYAKWYHKLGGVAIAAVGALVGFLSGGVMLGPALGLTALGLGSTMFGMGENEIILWFRDGLAEPIFNIALGFAWYMAVCVLVIRMMIYGFLGTGMAIMVPMGAWGRQKISSFFINVLAFILTPVVMAIGWFVALVVRVLYLEVSNVIIMMTYNVTKMSSIGFFAVMLVTFTLPFFFIMPLTYLFFRVPAYLAHIIGHVFSAGLGIAERMRAPMAR